MTEHDSTVVNVDHVTKTFYSMDQNGLQEHVVKWLLGKTGQPNSFCALNDVTFSVNAGETLGIIGKNGSGKSTLLKLLAGILTPTQGSVSVSGRICPMLGQGAGFYPDLTGRENAMLKASLLGLTDREVKEKIDDIIDFAELRDFIHAPVKRYSSGMAARLSFSVSIHCNPDILLADEALAVGDGQFRAKSLQRLKELQEAGVTILLASHNMSMVSELCTRVIQLRKGCLVSNGDPNEVIEMYTEAAPK